MTVVSKSVIQTIRDEILTDLLHPEFGSVYDPPDGVAYVAYQQGLADGEVRSSIKEKQTMAKTATTKKKSSVVDESVEIIPLEDGSGFTVKDTGLPAPTYNYNVDTMHKDDAIALGIVGAVFAAVIGGIGWFAYKDEQKVAAENLARNEERRRKREELEAWFEDQRKSGKVVMELADGSYMAVANDAYAAAEIRDKGL